MTSFREDISSLVSFPIEGAEVIKSNIETLVYIRPTLIDKLLIEVKRGVDKYGNFIDLDQFHQVLKDEVQELYDEFEAETIDLTKVWAEAMQVAAVAIRGIEEIERRTLG